MPATTFESFIDDLPSGAQQRNHFVHTPDLKDDRLWVPYGEGVWFQLCYVNASTGGFTVVVKILPGSQVAKHYHTGPVQGYTLQSKWRYLEYDWVATKGTFNFEPAGEAHTLVVPEDAAEPMIAMFVVAGGLIYLDHAGAFLAYEDGFTMLKLVQDYYHQAVIDVSRLEAIIR